MMNIAVAVNEAFVKYLYVMLLSLLEQNSGGNRQYSIYLLSADLREDQIQAIEAFVERYGWQFHFIQMEQTKFPKELPVNEMITIESYFRLLLPDLLPQEIEKILYLDVDLIINQPLDELYDMGFDGKCFIACKDVTATAAAHVAQSKLFAGLRNEPDFQYFNAGVLLFNLKKLREISSFEMLIQQALQIKDDLKFHDQDLLNYMFWKEVTYAETERFNLAARTAYNSGYDYSWVKEHTAILHYAGPKPWRHKEVRYELERLWWEYARDTPYYVELLEQMVLPEVDTGYMDHLFRQLKQENDELRSIVDKCMGLLKAKL